MGSTDGRTTSGVACHHSPWTANTVKRHQAWHAIIAFGQHRRSDGVGRCMPSSPLASTYSRTTLGVECHHRLWVAHMVERRQAWLAIIAFGQHRRSDSVERCMPSLPLAIIDSRTLSGVACHHCLWAAQTVGWRRALHAIIAFGQPTQSNDVGRGMTSPPLDNTHGRQH